MSTITPTSRTWTLRLKHNKTTILLHADPIQTLTSLKSDLLIALRDTHTSGTINGHQIPQNADDVILAKPVDINDLTQGWERLSAGAKSAENGSDAKGKGKATATAGANGKASAKMTNCPQGAGLRDGGVVAFKFRSEEEADGREGVGEGGDEDIAVLEEDRGPLDEEWDVVAPTIDEAYAEQDAAAAEELRAIHAAA